MSTVSHRTSDLRKVAVFPNLWTRSRYCRLMRLLALGILLISWGLFTYRLDQIPPGLQHDQTFNIFDAIEVLHGRHSIYFPSNFGKEGLFIYTIAGVYKLLGLHWIWGLRFASVIWGMLGLAVTVALSRRFLRYPVALLASLLMGGSFWLLFTARVGLRAISAMTLLAVGMYVLARGIVRQDWRILALSGLPVGLAMYTYLSARAFLALVPILMIYELLRFFWRRNKQRRSSEQIAIPTIDKPVHSKTREVVSGLVLSWLLTVGFSIPLFWYLRTYAGGFDKRLIDLGGPVLALLHGDWRPILQTGVEAILALLWADRQGIPYHYNVPGRAALPPYWATFFLVGAAFTLRESVHKRHAFLLIAATALGLAPALLSPGGPLYLRAIAAMPFVFILVARGVWNAGAWAVAQLKARVERSRGVIGFAILLTVLVGWYLFDNITAYFVTWRNATATQQIYNADLRLAATYLNSAPFEQEVYVSTDFWLDLDQQTYLLYEPIHRDVAWFYGPQGFPLPKDRNGLYVWTVSAPNNSRFLQALEQVGYKQDSIRGPDGCWTALTSVTLSPSGAELMVEQLGLVPVTPPLNFADILQLVAAKATVTGNQIEVVSRWAVIADWSRARPPKIATVLTDDSGYVWSQNDDRLAVAYQQWRPGGHFLQLTHIALPADIPPGTYRVLLRIYDEVGGNLPLSREGNRLATDPAVATATVGLQSDIDPAPTPPYPLTQPGAAQTLQLLGSWERFDNMLIGVPVNLHVSWRARESLDTAHLRFRLEAIDQATGQSLWSQDVTPAGPLPSVWPAGRTWRLTHRVAPQSPAAGAYQVNLRLCARQGDVIMGCAVVGETQVTSRPILWLSPFQPQYLSGAQWGDWVQLEGYDLAITGDTLQLTLLWHTQATPHQSLKRFVHVVDEQDKIIAQDDSIPGTARLDMRLWLPGEYVVDEVILHLPEGSAALRRLYLGFYDPSTGKRVPVQTTDGVEQADQRLPLAIMRGN